MTLLVKPSNRAEVLSNFRLLAGPLIGVIIVLGYWFDALNSLLWLASLLGGFAALSEVLDGWAARRWSDDTTRRWHGKSGKFSNELATGVYTNVVPGAILVCLLLDWRDHWSRFGATFLAVWLAACFLFAAATFVLGLGRGKLKPKSAERAEVAQGWVAGAIFGACSFAISVMSANLHDGLTMTAAAVSGACLGLAFVIPFTSIGNRRALMRIDERNAGNYKGTKTWSEFLRNPFAK